MEVFKIGAGPVFVHWDILCLFLNQKKSIKYVTNAELAVLFRSFEPIAWFEVVIWKPRLELCIVEVIEVSSVSR